MSHSLLSALDTSSMVQGFGLRGTARGGEVDPHPGLQWLVEAVEPLRAFSQHVLHGIRVRPVQREALCARLSAVQAGEVSAADASARLERAPQGVGGAMAPESNGLLALDVGERPRAMAQRVDHHGAQVVAPDCVPLFVTDGCRASLTALRPP